MRRISFFAPVAVAAVIACGGGPSGAAAARHQPPGAAAAAAGPVRDLLDPRLAAAVADTSGGSRTLWWYGGALLWPRDVPRGPSAGVTGCSLHAGDTIVYAYRDDSARRAVVADSTVYYAGEPIGVEVRPDTAPVRRTVDSLRAALEARYGPSAHCPDSSDVTPEGGRVYRWDVGDSAGVFLEWSPGSTAASLSVEAHGRAITCRSGAGPPYAR